MTTINIGPILQSHPFTGELFIANYNETVKLAREYVKEAKLNTETFGLVLGNYNAAINKYYENSNKGNYSFRWDMDRAFNRLQSFLTYGADYSRV